MVMQAVPPSTNPFGSPRALANSSYAAFKDGKLVRPRGGTCTGIEEFVHDSFRALVHNPKFSCVAAKSAINLGNYRIGNYAVMGEEASLEGLAHDLYEFVQEQPSFEGFSTFVATFNAPASGDELDFERRLWATLQRLHRIDRVHHTWDPAVSSDPESKDFSFSFAGRAFFLVGLHPGSSRFTRRFAFPTLVFNAHTQFEKLRADGKFERVQDVIRARDRALQGDLNVNLADYGEASEARQYSGRAVEKDWRCPFHHANDDEAT